MASKVRLAVAPAYLFACLLLGGSAQGLWQNLLLQLVGLVLIAWAALHKDARPLPAFARRVLVIALAAVALVALQLVPIPFAWWASLGPRHEIAAGYRLLGLAPAALPLSLAPFEGMRALLTLIPPIAIFCAMVRLKAYRGRWMAIAVLAAAGAGIVLGCLQVASPSRQSPWYLYPETNFGSAVGFFANANHMGMLLVACFPFLAALSVGSGKDDLHVRSAKLALIAGTGLVLLVGLALNGSFAAYGLALPVVVASGLIAFGGNRRLRLWGPVAILLLLVASVAILEVTPIGANLLTEKASTSVASRQEIFSTTAHAVRDFLPFGSGLGSFRSVYHLYESPEGLTSTYVVHAHNDYLEFALETGIAGALLIALFIGCWGVAAWRAWDARDPSPFARAAAIATAAILVHSLVDYPLRTSAIGALFAMSLALLTERPAPAGAGERDWRPARHIQIR